MLLDNKNTDKKIDNHIYYIINAVYFWLARFIKLLVMEEKKKSNILCDSYKLNFLFI